jgi:hypothetical protein
MSLTQRMNRSRKIMTRRMRVIMMKMKTKRKKQMKRLTRTRTGPMSAFVSVVRECVIDRDDLLVHEFD